MAVAAPIVEVSVCRVGRIGGVLLRLCSLVDGDGGGMLVGWLFRR
jgi:hypothetical protein